MNDEEGKYKEYVKPPVKQDLVWETKIFDAKLHGMDSDEEEFLGNEIHNL